MKLHSYCWFITTVIHVWGVACVKEQLRGCEELKWHHLTHQTKNIRRRGKKLIFKQMYGGGLLKGGKEVLFLGMIVSDEM